MTLLRPEFLWLFVLWLPFTYWWLNRQQVSGWQQVIDPNLLAAFMKPTQRKNNLTRSWLPAIALLTIVALAGPALLNSQQKTASQGNLFVILDNSLSMAATDIEPDRITRAKRMIIDWAKSGLFDKTSVITYSASAHTLTPLTRDAQTIELQLQSLNPYMMPEFGNRAELAFKLINDIISENGYATPHILWLTDDIAAAKVDAIKSNLPNYVSATLVAIGTEAGNPIPLPNNQGFLMNGNEMVIVKADLNGIASRGRSLGFQTAQLGAQPSAELFSQLKTQSATQLGVKDFGYWFIFPIVALWLWFGRSYSAVASLLVFMFIATPNDAMAADLFKNNEQQAYSALIKGDNEQALTLSNNPMLRGQALFQSQQFEAAANEFSINASAEALFNQGNALANAGKLKEAIAAYDAALKITDIEQASKNKKLIEDFLKNQPQEQGQQQGDGENQEQENDQQQNGDQNNSEQSQQQQEEQNADQPSDEESDQQAQQESEQKQDGSEGEENQQQTQGLNPEEMREEQETEAVLNKLQPNGSSLLQQKFRYQYQQNPTQTDGTLW